MPTIAHTPTTPLAMSDTGTIRILLAEDDDSSRARLTASRSVESSTFGGVGFGRNATADVAVMSRSVSVTD